MLELERFSDLIGQGRLREAFTVGSRCELLSHPLYLSEEDGLASDSATWLGFFRKFMSLHAALKEHELARYLWRRSPHVLKNDAEFEALWRVNKLCLKNSTTSAMKILLTTSWSPDLQPIVKITVQILRDTQFQHLSLLYGIEAAQHPRQHLIYDEADEAVWNESSGITPSQAVSTAALPACASSMMTEMAEYVAYVVRKPPTVDLKSADKKTGKAISVDPARK